MFWVQCSASVSPGSSIPSIPVQALGLPLDYLRVFYYSRGTLSRLLLLLLPTAQADLSLTCVRGISAFSWPHCAMLKHWWTRAGAFLRPDSHGGFCPHSWELSKTVLKFQSTYFLEDVPHSSKPHLIPPVLLLATAFVLTIRNP
ncbi:hypothetical protein A6R68_12101, partial [Neotoma lepida]